MAHLAASQQILTQLQSDNKVSKGYMGLTQEQWLEFIHLRLKSKVSDDVKGELRQELIRRIDAMYNELEPFFKAYQNSVDTNTRNVTYYSSILDQVTNCLANYQGLHKNVVEYLEELIHHGKERQDASEYLRAVLRNIYLKLRYFL